MCSNNTKRCNTFHTDIVKHVSSNSALVQCHCVGSHTNKSIDDAIVVSGATTFKTWTHCICIYITEFWHISSTTTNRFSIGLITRVPMTRARVSDKRNFPNVISSLLNIFMSHYIRRAPQARMCEKSLHPSTQSLPPGPRPDASIHRFNESRNRQDRAILIVGAGLPCNCDGTSCDMLGKHPGIGCLPNH